MLALDESQKVEMHVDHFFSDGVYARVCTIEPGCAVIGKTHKTNHLSVILEGTITISSKYGTALYNAPYIIHSMAGDKRAVIAHTKVKYMTIHPTEETNIAKLEEMLVIDDSKQQEVIEEQKKCLSE